jgi:hypothetical protein
VTDQAPTVNDDAEKLVNPMDNNNNNKIILLTVPSGCIISLKSVITETSTPKPTITKISPEFKQKKPQVVNIDSIKHKILLNQGKDKTIADTKHTVNLKSKLNDYINNLIIKNEYIKQNMPQLNKPKEIRNLNNVGKYNTDKTNRIYFNNNNKKLQSFHLDGHNHASLNMIHTTFSFNYEKTKKLDDNIDEQFLSDQILKPNDNGLINSISSNKKLNLIHSSHSYGLTNVANLDQYKNDLKNLIHLVPLHKESLNKLIEPILKDHGSIPKPLYQWGRKLNDLNNIGNVKGKGNGRYECIECGIRTKKPSMLKKHIRSHANLRPYICKQCNISFKTKGNLVKHMKTKAHVKKMNKNDLNNMITIENIDSNALKRQEEIEKRLIFKDDVIIDANNNNNNNKKRKLNDLIDDNFELDYFESVQDVAKSLLNLSQISRQTCNENGYKLNNQELENV